MDRLRGHATFPGRPYARCRWAYARHGQNHGHRDRLASDPRGLVRCSRRSRHRQRRCIRLAGSAEVRGRDRLGNHWPGAGAGIASTGRSRGDTRTRWPRRPDQRSGNPRVRDWRLPAGIYAGARCPHCGHAPRRRRRRQFIARRAMVPRQVETFDYVLVATGRTPNVQGIGLEKTSVARDVKGVPGYDPATAQTVNADGNAGHGAFRSLSPATRATSSRCCTRRPTKGALRGTMPRVSRSASR